MLLDEILAFEMRDARLLVGIGNGRVDQMPDAGILRSFRGNDALTGLFLGPSLVAVAHQKHGVDAACCLQNRRCVAEIASHEISACRHQLPRSVAIRLAGQRLDAMSPGQQRAHNRASLLPGSAGDQNASFGAHMTAPLVFHWSKLGMPHCSIMAYNWNLVSSRRAVSRLPRSCLACPRRRSAAALRRSSVR